VVACPTAADDTIAAAMVAHNGTAILVARATPANPVVTLLVIGALFSSDIERKGSRVALSAII
jgi:hypothetical protein